MTYFKGDATAMHYKGTWLSGGSYSPTDVVVRQNALYHAINPTQPQSSPLTTAPETAAGTETVIGAIGTNATGGSNGFGGSELEQQFSIATAQVINQLAFVLSLASTDTFTLSISNTSTGPPLVVNGVTLSGQVNASGVSTFSWLAAQFNQVTLPAGSYWARVSSAGSTAPVYGQQPPASSGAITNIGGWYSGGVAGGNQNFTINFQFANATVNPWEKLLDLGGGSRAVSAATQMLPSDEVIVAGGSSYTVTLPAVGQSIGKRYTIKNIGTGTITIAPASGTIDGAANKTLTVQYSSLDLVTDGTNWFTV